MDAHGRLDAKSVAEEPALADEQSEVLAFFENGSALGGGGFLGAAVFEEFDAEHEPFTADFADDRVLFGELVEACDQVVAALQ